MAKSKPKASLDKQKLKRTTSNHKQKSAASTALQLRAIADKQTKMQILRTISEISKRRCSNGVWSPREFDRSSWWPGSRRAAEESRFFARIRSFGFAV